MKALVSAVLLAALVACRCPDPLPPQVVKVPVPVPCAPIYLPPKPDLPIAQLTPQTTLAERDRLILLTLKILTDRAKVLEDLIRAHNEAGEKK